jgi:hypothetical protein
MKEFELDGAITRRGAIAVTAGAMLTPAALGAAPQPWFDKPMRWAQLVFVEDDPGNYDMQFWLDYFRRTHVDGVCLAGGGYVAYYPTQVPFHHASRWMKPGTDPFGDLVRECRKMGLAVIARTDPHAAREDVHQAHPDWLLTDQSGNRRRHWANPELWVTCALGPYNFEFMTAVTREITKRYQVDGVFSNRWSGSGKCFCEHCRRNFRDATGLDLTAKDSGHAYTLWRQRRLFDLWRIWDAAIREANPNACFIANSGGGALSNLDMSTIGELAPILFADRQARHGTVPPWANGKNAKEYRSTMGAKPIGGIFSVGVEESYRWKDSVQSPEELKIWVVDGIAHGLRPWYAKFNAKIIDKRWLKPVEEIYTWHWRNEKYLRNKTPVAAVGLVYSQQTAWFYGGEQAQRKVEDHTLGFYQALVESRIPFEMVHDRLLTPERIAAFDTLILPNVAALSDAQCFRLRQFVSRGGNLVATYETSLYDENGVRRADFGLADLFGASFAGQIDSRMQNSYLNIEKDLVTGRYHPLLAGLENTPRIINGVSRVHVTAAEKGYAPLTLVPTYPDLPMEDVYTRGPKTSDPQVFARDARAGGGRVVYFPWDIDRTYWEILQRDHFVLLANAVRWAHGKPQPVEVRGPGMVDVAAWRQAGSMTIHLVNLTNPMTMRGSYREVIPIGPQSVAVHLFGKRVRSVHLLSRGGPARFTQAQDRITIDVPGVGLHEVVAIDFV